jgi:predicted O-methyltransferase YrrM
MKGRNQEVINRLKDHAQLVTPLKDFSFRLFMALDKIGVHLLPKHYYTPIPDYRWLRHNSALWMPRAPLCGLDWNLEEQLSWLAALCGPYYQEVQGFKFYESITEPGVAVGSNLARISYGEGFGPIESQILHCFIRSVHPRRIVEIGAGVSTACMLHASEQNGSDSGLESITCIEPFPKRSFRRLKSVRLIRDYCQNVPISTFRDLGEGDLLFIDSSHTVKIGSDVNHIFLKVIPQLRPGVYIHVHDIVLPYLYNRDALDNYFGWQETALLLALLTNNTRLKVLSSLSALHYDHPVRLASILTDYRPQADNEGLRLARDAPGHFPSSIWLRTV